MHSVTPYAHDSVVVFPSSHASCASSKTPSPHWRRIPAPSVQFAVQTHCKQTHRIHSFRLWYCHHHIPRHLAVQTRLHMWRLGSHWYMRHRLQNYHHHKLQKSGSPAVRSLRTMPSPHSARRQRFVHSFSSIPSPSSQNSYCRSVGARSVRAMPSPQRAFRQSLVQLSVGSLFPSSQSSTPKCRCPSPHSAVRHVLVQLSRSLVFPSSHTSKAGLQYRHQFE